ncbi:MAG: NUDIX-like domain-containing protein, partial [Rhodospirillales bacterium]
MVENLSYTAVGLDRAAHLRRDEAWIDARLTNPTTRVAPLWQSLNLIDARSAEPKAVFLNAADGQALVSQAEEVIFLGLDDNTAYAAVDISSLDEATAADIAAGGEFIDLRRLGALMGEPDASIVAYARGMVHWHRRH